jgi:hypothetical protein
MKPQTPPTLKDLEFDSMFFGKDVRNSLKRLRDEIELSDINGSIFVLNKIDEIMGVFE